LQNLCFVVNDEEVLKVKGSHVHFKSGSVLKTVLDKEVETTVHKQSDMPYGDLIAATTMTLGVCQVDFSSIASFLSILTSDKHVSQSLCHSRASRLSTSQEIGWEERSESAV